MSRSESLGRRYFRLTLWNILASITAPLAGLVDVAMLGHLPSLRFLAGVALGSLLFDYIYWGLGFLRMATTATTARAMGRGDGVEIRASLYRPLALALGLGLLVLAGRDAIAELGFSLLDGEASVEAAGREYFHARVWGAPAALANLVLLGWFLGREESRLVLWTTLVANLSNVGLNYLLILKLGLAAEGAGLATTISQVLMLALGAALAFPRLRGRTPPLAELFAAERILPLVRFQFDILLRTLCLLTSMAVFTNASALLGTTMLAANTVLLRLFTLSAYLIDGAAYATESLAGNFHARGERAALVRLLRLSNATALGLAALSLAAVFAVPGALIALLTSHAELRELAAGLAPWLVPVLMLGAPAFIYDGFFLGLAAGRTLRNAMLLSTFAVFLPAAVLALERESAHLLWLAFSLFMLARTLTLLRASLGLLRAVPAPAAAAGAPP